MLLRKVLIAAAVVAPLVGSPASVSAQDRGRHEATNASAHADAAPGLAKNSASKRPQDLPPGMAKRRNAETLPPGIRRTRQAPETDPATQPEPDTQSEPDPQPEPEPDAGECLWGTLWVNGLPSSGSCTP